ncbi:hypothetical protein BC832DRAFT_223343 [Gaertneriomyces semiglobifer]|nr:hypothetical protein BC832DRAFT_223343 [Gaertneriomyces semiglobifer]
MRREMSSRFSVGPVSHTGIFVSLMTHCDSPTGMTDLIDEWSHKDIDVLSRSYGSLVYIETLADVFYHVLKIEAHPITERQRTASEESSGVRDSCIDSPIARKRARRSDVLGDISRTFASRSPTKDEKALLLQTLSILLTKYRSELGGDACQALIEHSQFVLDEPTTELHSWALLCLACLITTPQIDCKLVWDLALRSLTLSTTRDAAWALLSSVLSARVLPNDMHAAAQTEFWKMLELHACVDSHFMGICRVIQNLDDMSTVPILAIVERLMSSVQALSAVTVVDVLVVLTGTTKLRQTELNAIVRDAAPPFYSIKDDYVSEWRFTCMMRIWRGVVNKDFKQLLSVITDESSAGDKVTQNSRAASKTVSHSQLILALELGMKKFLQGETVKDVHTCCKLLAAICFMTTIIPQPDKIVTLSLCDMLNTLAKTLSALTVQTTSVKASDLEPLSEYFKAYNPTSELSINPGLMIPLLWPLSRPIYEELLDKTFQYLLRCVKTGFPAENDNRVKRGEDEFEVLSAASDHLKLGAALHIQTEFLGVPFGSNCPTQSAFTALTDLYMAATKVTGLEDIRAKLTKTLCNAITTPTIPFLPADAVRFLAALAPFAMTDQVDSILEHIAHLLSSYESERNFRCWVWILQCLAALASCLTRLCLGELTRNSIEETIKKRACDYLAFFSNTRVWRVKMSLGSAMLSLVFADPTLSFLSQCFSAEVAAAKDPAFQAIFNLLHHEELQVRLAFGQRIPCLFDLFAEEDHETILTDVLSALENANTKVEGHGEEEKEEIVTRKLTSAVAMTECSVRATWHRAGCISGVLALLSPTGDDADGLDLITQLLNMVAERLHIASGSEFLEAVLPAVIWAWDGPAATFPYQVLGYHGEAGFLQEWGAYWVARAWQPNKTLNKNELQSLGGLSRAWMEQVLAIMLPTCQPKNIRTGQYPPAIANVRELCGDRFVPEVKKRAPHIIGEIISRCYDPALASIPVEYAAVVKYWTAMRAQSDPGSSPTFGPPEILPRFDAKAIIAGLETLSLLLLPEDVDGAVSRLGELLSTDTLERAFRDLHLRLFKDPFASSRARLLTNGYGLLVALALSLDTISHPYLYAIVIKCLVRYIAYPESISICIGILVPLIDHGVMHEDLRATLSQMVVQLGDISQALLTTRPTHANFVLELVIRTLRTMQNINEESVRLTVLQLDSRLQVESRFNTEFRTRIVASDLSKLLKIGPGPGSIRFLREATELHRIPDELGQQIVNFIITTLKKIDEFDDKNRELIFDCVAILARLSTCLGLKFKDTTAPTNVINEKLRVQGVHSNDAENCHLGHAVALHHLTEQSNNDDEFVVDRAVTVLRAILGTTLGEKAFHLLSEKEPTLIDLFIPSISVSTIVAAANSGFLSAEHDDVWLPEEVGGHVQESAFDAWIVKITMSVLLHFPTNELFPILVPAVEDSPVLAETIFKYVVHCALLKEVAEAAISVGRRKSPTLRLRQTLSRQFKRVLQRAGALPSRFINAILKIVEFLRTQPVPAAADIFEANAWLDLDFLILARAAVITQSFATSLLFLEISREKQLRPWGLLAMSDDRNPNAEKETTDLLLNIYRNIGDQDGYDGVDALRKDVLWDDVERLVSRYEHDGAWEKVLNIRETQLKALPGSKEDTVIHTDFIKSLSKLSYYHLLDICVTGAGDAAGTKDVKEAHYEALWRCQRWDDGEQHKAGKNYKFLWRCK